MGITLRPSTPVGWRAVATAGVAVGLAIAIVLLGVAPVRLDGKILIAGDGLLGMLAAAFAAVALLGRGDRSIACVLCIVPIGLYGFALFLEGARLME